VIGSLKKLSSSSLLLTAAFPFALYSQSLPFFRFCRQQKPIPHTILVLLARMYIRIDIITIR